jgi:hypothetical protein
MPPPPAAAPSRTSNACGILVPMRRLVLLVTFAALVAPQAIAAPRPPATIRLVDRDPVTIAGTHFRSHERVKVTINAGGVQHTRRVIASAAGTFRAKFVDVSATSCGLYAGAVGSRGARATLSPPRACTADIAPPPVAP